MRKATPRGVSHRRRAQPAVRPTQARVRDALFNRLAAEVGGAQVLDLFAGMGTLGIEALRRGAAAVVFVEQDAKLVREIRRRVSEAGLEARAEVRGRDALEAIGELSRADRRFNVIIMDPPYGENWIPATLQAIVSGRLLAPGGVVVAEGHWRDRPEPPAGLVLRREARYGETALWYFAATASE